MNHNNDRVEGVGAFVPYTSSELAIILTLSLALDTKSSLTLAAKRRRRVVWRFFVGPSVPTLLC